VDNVTVLIVATQESDPPVGMMRLANWLATRQKTTVAVVRRGDLPVGHVASAGVDPSSTVLLGVNAGPDRRSAIEVATASPFPVWIVPMEVATLPRRAVLALDFSWRSVRAAKAALDLLERPAAAHMVSVGSQLEAGTTQPHVQLLFDAVEDSLGHPADVAITRHSLAGDVASAILTFAKINDADLIAIGRASRSHTGIAQTVVASAPCSLLIVPSPQ
jgi:nucleotide-binding universal stress UspA family protein